MWKWGKRDWDETNLMQYHGIQNYTDILIAMEYLKGTNIIFCRSGGGYFYRLGQFSKVDSKDTSSFVDYLDFIEDEDV